MYCTVCGQRIDDDARFCEHCGMPIFANLTEEKLAKLREQKAAAKAPQQQAAPRFLRCPACGMQLPLGAHFCDRCGRVIEA